MAFDGIYRPLAERCEIEASELADAGFNDASVVLYEAEARIRSLEAEITELATALTEAEARGRRQGLEEAAKVADMRDRGTPDHGSNCARAIASSILALRATTPAETQKHDA